MKTKPNFTYKEFIEKISQTNTTTKDPVESKSPRVLKSHNKNVPSSSLTYNDKLLQNKNLNNKRPSFNMTPRTNTRNQNVFQEPSQRINDKNSTNKKLSMKGSLNTDRLTSRQESMKQSKKLHIAPNFSYNESCYEQQKHGDSYSTFYKNFNYENEEDNFNYNETKLNNKSSSINNFTKTKKNPAGSIDAKLKIQTKGNVTSRNGNKTDRQNRGKRVVTQYEDNKCLLVTDRMNTQYEKSTHYVDRESPSFYKMSVDEGSFLDFQEDKSHRNLFTESSSLYGAKKSTFSLQSQQKSPKMNQKSLEHIYNKFITTISQMLFQITKISNQTELLAHRVKYIQFLQCLKELKMIKSDYEPYSQSQGVDMVKQFWQQLVMGQNVSHFIIIVALILKITPNQQIKGQNSMQFQNCVYLQKKYQNFRFTRLQLDNTKNFAQRQGNEFYNFPFKPTLSKNTQSIIQKSKSKQKKYKINTSVNQNNENSQMRVKKENVSINTEFQNQNQNSSSRSIIRATSPLGSKRSEILYKQAKKKSLQKRENKSTIDYEYEKNKNQLTFKPKIIIKRKKPQNQELLNSYLSPRVMIDEEKNINRIIRGRVERQVKQMTIDRGLPYNEKTIQKLRKQKFQEILKQQNQSRIKKLEQNQCKMKNSQIQTKFNENKSDYCYERCTTQVQNLQNILNLSFEGTQKQFQKLVNNNDDEEKIEKEEPLTQYLENTNYKQQQKVNQQQNDQAENQEQQTVLNDDFFTLDIYFEQEKSQKLMIKRDSTIQQVFLQAQKFVLTHNLPKQMQKKLKQQLLIAMKFHDVEKIQENDEQQECSLLL